MFIDLQIILFLHLFNKIYHSTWLKLRCKQFDKIQKKMSLYYEKKRKLRFLKT